MVRVTLALIILCIFGACNDGSKPADVNIPVVKNDTFDFFEEEYDIPIPKGFSVDTIRSANDKTDFEGTLICPMLAEKEFFPLNQVLKKEIIRKAMLEYTDTSDLNPVDTSKEAFGVRYENIPLVMYKDQHTISYGFLSTSTGPDDMRPYRKYFSINYDIVRKQFFYLSDFIKISGSADSILVKSIIYGEVGNPETQWYTLSNNINFSFDKDYVYFYFDMFGETATPMGLVKRVKRKYLHQFINDNYK